MIREATWYGEISGGKLSLSQPELFRVWLGAVKHQGPIEIVIRGVSAGKTNAQLAYYFGVLVKELSDYAGYSKDEADGVLCRRFLTANRGQPNEYVRSKADLTTEEMSAFIDSVILLLAECGVVVPPQPVIKKCEQSQDSSCNADRGIVQ